jgi:TPR repeat protein
VKKTKYIIIIFAALAILATLVIIAFPQTAEIMVGRIAPQSASRNKPPTLEEEAATGKPESMYKLAIKLNDSCTLESEIGKQVAQRQAFDLLVAAANKGNNLARIKLACIYRYIKNIAGDGNLAKSREFTSLVIQDTAATPYEVALAKISLADSYFSDDGDFIMEIGEPDERKQFRTDEKPVACKLYKEAFPFAPKEAGLNAAFCEIKADYGPERAPEYNKIIDYLEKAGAAGETKGYKFLGYSHLKPNSNIIYERYKLDWIEADPVKAAKYLSLASDAGSPEAKNTLGVLYFKGEGVPKNYETAAKLFYEAAQNDYAESRFYLAYLYLMGKGVETNKIKALAWLSLAVNKLDDDFNYGQKNRAKKDIALLERELSPEQVRKAQELTKDWKPDKIPLFGEITPAKISFGTGFIVSNNGFIATNEHVIKGCKEITVGVNAAKASLVGKDVANDLALLKIEGLSAPAIPIRTNSPAQLGEPIVVFGFPLTGVVASTGNLVEGTVSAVVGFKDNVTTFQITAPVQPGNSGGPVFDRQGNVIGVVVSKLDAVSVARATKDVPQNVNFAIHVEILRAVLDAHRVQYKSDSWFTLQKSPQEIAKAAQLSVLPITCTRI